MHLKGIVSSIDNGVRVVIPSRANNVSYPVKLATHISKLEVGDNVAILFFSSTLIDGLIIAKFE